MKQELKQKWVAALRSGEYKQGKHALKNSKAFCCLGVLVEVEFPQCWRKPVTEYSDWPFVYDKDMPRRGFFGPDFLEDVGLPSEVMHDLVSFNDQGAPFKVIADIIEERVPVEDDPKERADEQRELWNSSDERG